MTPLHSELPSRLLALLAASMLVVQLLMVTQRMLLTNIRLFAIQSFLLSAIAVLIAFSFHAPHVYFMAALTFAGKVIALPWFLRRLVRQVGIEHEMHPWINAPTSMLLCGGFTLLGYLVARPFSSMARLGHNTFGVSIALLLMGLFLMINRRRAITQVLALLCAENGLFLAAISLTTYGMPLVVELGIFFDLFIAVMVLGILVFRIRATFASIDVDQLNRLRG
jgi:hydrogenase-4 component E